MSVASIGSEQRGGVISVDSEGAGIVAVCLEGEFDLANAAGVREGIEHELELGNNLIVDLSRATFIDSTIIHVLAAGSQTAVENGRTIVLQLGSGSIVERALTITGITRRLRYAPSRTAARKLIPQQAMPGEPAFSRRTVAVRFLDGEMQYWRTDRVFSVGETIEQNGRTWVVADVAGSRETGRKPRVTLESVNGALPKADAHERDRVAWNLPMSAQPDRQPAA